MTLQSNVERPYHTQLRQMLGKHFDLDGLRTLCFDIGVDFDELAGDNKTAKIRALIEYLQKRGRLDDLLAAAALARPHVDWPEPADIAPENPYRGLFAFREADADNFFGRDEFAARLAGAVQNRTLVAVVGASGSGKSSLVFAGLLPHLRQAGGWLTVDFRPKSDPFLELARALTPLLYDDEIDLLANTRKLAAALANGDLPLLDVVNRILQKQPNAQRLLLFADQFEELYTLTPQPKPDDPNDPHTRQRFLDMLLAAVSGSAGQPISQSANQPTDSSFTLILQTSHLLDLRADFLGQALANRPFADALDNATELLGPMNRAELAQTIEKPAARQGVGFEAGLVERFLDDVGDEPGNLPLLEFALENLWEQQRGGQLTHVGYEQIGRVQGALAAYADEVYAGLSDPEKEQARRGYVQLVKPGAGTEDTRRVATRREVGEENWLLITQLATARLLVTNQDEDGQETVEVVHEALIKRWGRLQAWMQADRVFREWQERLRAAQRGWKASGQDEGALLRGATLGEAQGWLEERSEDLIDGLNMIS